MTNLKIKLATGLVTASLLAATVAPAAFAATDITVSGNGAGSHNKVKVKNKNKTKVVQSNATAVVNLTGVFQNTGGNTANNNTGGGNVDVNSGNATSTVTNHTTTGGNVATVDPCGCPTGDTLIDVSGNGADSTNKVKVKNTSTTTVRQTNETLVVNGTLVAQNTGGNHANNNTGDGTVDVNSGDADSTVTNTVTTGGNLLSP
jgi:hypothetical protein